MKHSGARNTLIQCGFLLWMILFPFLVGCSHDEVSSRWVEFELNQDILLDNGQVDGEIELIAMKTVEHHGMSSITSVSDEPLSLAEVSYNDIILEQTGTGQYFASLDENFVEGDSFEVKVQRQEGDIHLFRLAGRHPVINTEVFEFPHTMSVGDRIHIPIPETEGDVILTMQEALYIGPTPIEILERNGYFTYTFREEDAGHTYMFSATYTREFLFKQSGFTIRGIESIGIHSSVSIQP